MTRQEDFARDWQETIKRSYEHRDKKFKSSPGKTYKEMCKDNRKYYRGDWLKTVMPVNRVFSYGRSLIPATYFRNPRVAVTATKPQYVWTAKVVEAVDNWLIFEAKLKKTIKKAILNCYQCGCGPVKLGYDSQFGYLLDQAVDEDSGTATQESKKEDRMVEYEDSVKSGMPWALPDLPENVIGPPGYSDWESMPWIAHRVLRPLIDVQQDQKYTNTKDLQGTRTIDWVPQSQMSLFKDYDEKYPICELFEVRDKSRRTMFTICEGRTLLSNVDPLQIEGLPWEFLIFNEDPEYPWGIPDVSMVESQQLELNEIRSQSRRHRAIALLKFLFKKGVFKEAELEKFFSGEVGPGIEALTDEGLSNVIMMLQPHIPPDLRAEAMQADVDFRATLRMSENQASAFKGGTPPTASETSEVAQSFDLNTDERRDIVGDLMTNIIRKWNQMIFRFWDKKKVVQIAGPDGEQWWVNYTGDELKGEYNLRIDPDSGFPISRQVRMESAGGLLKAYNGDVLIDQVALRKMHISQLEWLYPGITGLVKEAPQDIASAVSNLRQPGAQEGQGHLPMGQRGGGRGKEPEKPIEIGEFRQKYERKSKSAQ